MTAKITMSDGDIYIVEAQNKQSAKEFVEEKTGKTVDCVEVSNKGNNYVPGTYKIMVS